MNAKVRDGFWALLLALAGIAFGGIVLALVFGGCCPVCLGPYPVAVNAPCALPPAVVLPAVEPLASCKGGEFMCFDMLAAKQLALREARMKQWIKEARAACTPAASQPATSQPVK